MSKFTCIGTMLLLATATANAAPRQSGETLAAVSHSDGTRLQSSKRNTRESTTLVEVLRRLNREKAPILCSATLPSAACPCSYRI